MFSATFFWIVEAIMLCNAPYAMIGLMKYRRGKYGGQDKLSDLIRATVYVDESNPEQIFTVFNHI